MIYRGFHIRLEGGRYVVFDGYRDGFYVGRRGAFNDRRSAQAWVRECIKAAAASSQRVSLVSPVHVSQVAERHYAKLCPVCLRPVKRDLDHGVTFTGGEFRVFHDECAIELFGAANSQERRDG